MAAPQADTNHNCAASYPDSGDSSPRSRCTDCDKSSLSAAASCDDAPPPLPPLSLSYRSTHAHRLKFLCSYGGRIQPRPHDNQLAYVGGDTKIVAVDRSVRYSQLLARLASLMMLTAAAPGALCFKYQLPGEDLDALISVTNDEDVDHMMVEYDLLQRSSAKPPRLRLFLFPVRPAARAFPSSDPKASQGQWFVDALNSMPEPPVPPTDSLPPPPPAPASAIGNPDFLFGLDKGFANFPCPLTIHDPAPETEADASPLDDDVATTGSDSIKEDRWVGGETPVARLPEIQRQIPELQTPLHVASQQETSGATHRQQLGLREGHEEEILSRPYPREHYLPSKGRLVRENAPTPTVAPQIPVAYLHERLLADGGVYSSMARLEQPVYFIPPAAPPSMFPGMNLQTLASEGGKGYYAATKQSVGVGATVHQPVYMVAPPPQPSAKTVGAIAKQGLGEARGTAKLVTAYDGAGRPLYFVRPAAVGAGGSVMPAVQAQVAASADGVRCGATPQCASSAGQLATGAAGGSAVSTAQLLNPTEGGSIPPPIHPLQAS